MLMEPSGDKLDAVAAAVIRMTATAVRKKTRASDLEKPGLASMHEVTARVASARMPLL